MSVLKFLWNVGYILPHYKNSGLTECKSSGSVQFFLKTLPVLSIPWPHLQGLEKKQTSSGVEREVKGTHSNSEERVKVRRWGVGGLKEEEEQEW